MPEKILEFGLAGAIMGLVMYIVVKPLVDLLARQLISSQEERQKLCAEHHQFHQKTNAVLERLIESVDGLAKRANGVHWEVIMPATWQAGSTAPPIIFVLTENGLPYDLTGKSVHFRFARAGQQALWECVCEIDAPAADGLCHYDWEPNDLAQSGDYEGQLIIIDGANERYLPPFPIQVSRTIPEPSA